MSNTPLTEADVKAMFLSEVLPFIALWRDRLRPRTENEAIVAGANAVATDPTNHASLQHSTIQSQYPQPVPSKAQNGALRVDLWGYPVEDDTSEQSQSDLEIACVLYTILRYLP